MKEENERIQKELQDVSNVGFPVPCWNVMICCPLFLLSGEAEARSCTPRVGAGVSHTVDCSFAQAGKISNVPHCHCDVTERFGSSVCPPGCSTILGLVTSWFPKCADSIVNNDNSVTSLPLHLVDTCMTSQWYFISYIILPKLFF